MRSEIYSGSLSHYICIEIPYGSMPDSYMWHHDYENARERHANKREYPRIQFLSQRTRAKLNAKPSYNNEMGLN